MDSSLFLAPHRVRTGSLAGGPLQGDQQPLAARATEGSGAFRVPDRRLSRQLLAPSAPCPSVGVAQTSSPRFLLR